jgi:hypothetical protein
VKAKPVSPPFDRLVAQVMSQEPYRSTRRVFWIMDNGSPSRSEGQGTPSGAMAHSRPRAYPVHASWLNQVEIYFSIVQRKVLTPNDFTSLGELEDRLLRFQDRYLQIATPFQWTLRAAWQLSQSSLMPRGFPMRRELREYVTVVSNRSTK